MKPIAEPRGSIPAATILSMQPAVTDEVDLLDPGRAVSDTGAGEERVDRPAALLDRAVDRGGVGEVDLDGLDAGEADVGVVHDHDLGAGVLHQLGRGRAHAGGAADHEHSLAVVPKCVEQRPSLFSSV